MATTTRFGVAKTQKSLYPWSGCRIGSTIKSETEQWNTTAYGTSETSSSSYFLILIGVSSEATFFFIY